MSTQNTLHKIDFEKHAAAAIKAQRLQEMIVVEAEHLDDPEAEILAQIADVTAAVKAMFAKKGRAH